MKAPRKITKFHVCQRHVRLELLSRYRRAEFFCEGGPSGDPCDSSDPCRIWPGTDLFVESSCHGEADWPARWEVNTRAA